MPAADAPADRPDPAAVFADAAGRTEPADRAAFLDDACGGDAALREEVAGLLDAHDRAGDFLNTAVARDEAPAVDVSALLGPCETPGRIGTLGGYEVESVVGRGGMGVVLKAHDRRLNRVVAVKVLAPEFAADPVARRRFAREARAAAAVSHPHVVVIHAVETGDAGASRTVPHLVMEYVAGRSLQQKLDAEGALEVREILRIGTQTARGLAAAHAQGLTHRDVKPGNVLLENGVERVKLTDFGLARAADDVAVTRPGDVAGTPGFMSPEQAEGEGGRRPFGPVRAGGGAIRDVYRPAAVPGGLAGGGAAEGLRRAAPAGPGGEPGRAARPRRGRRSAALQGPRGSVRHRRRGRRPARRPPRRHPGRPRPRGRPHPPAPRGRPRGQVEAAPPVGDGGGGAGRRAGLRGRGGGDGRDGVGAHRRAAGAGRGGCWSSPPPTPAWA